MSNKNAKEKSSKEQEKFAPGLCFFKLFWVFIIFSVLGSYYEQTLNYYNTWHMTGNAVWELRRGVIYGPLNVIYGFGAVILIYILARKTRPGWQTYLYGALLGGGFEAAVGLLQRIFIGTKSWDYSWHILNIGGLTSVPVMLFWGLCAFIGIKFIWPLLSDLIERVPVHFGNIFTTIMIVLVSFDIIISWSALIRQTLRQHGYPAYTIVGKFYDRYYDDEYLAKFFPNMREK